MASVCGGCSDVKVTAELAGKLTAHLAREETERVAAIGGLRLIGTMAL